MAAQNPRELLHDIERWADDPRRAFAAIGALRTWLDETEKGLKTRVKE